MDPLLAIVIVLVLAVAILVLVLIIVILVLAYPMLLPVVPILINKLSLDCLVEGLNNYWEDLIAYKGFSSEYYE